MIDDHLVLSAASASRDDQRGERLHTRTAYGIDALSQSNLVVVELEYQRERFAINAGRCVTEIVATVDLPENSFEPLTAVGDNTKAVPQVTLELLRRH